MNKLTEGGIYLKISKTSVFYNIMTLTFSNIGLHILGFIYRIFLSRMTGAEGMGVYQLILPAYSVLSSFCITGLTMATSRLSAICISDKRPLDAHRVVRVSVRVFLFLFSLIALTVIPFSSFIAENVLGDIRTRASLLVILPCLLFTGIENILKNFFFGTSNLKPPITSELSEQIVRFIAVIALLFTINPKNPAQSSALIICGMVISEVVSVIILSRFYGRKACSKTPVLKKIINIAFPVSLAAIFNNLLSAANSVLIPKRLISYGLTPDAALSEFGVLFGMTMPVVCLPFGLIGALVTVSIPKMSEGAENFSYLRRKAGKIIHTTSLIAIPSMCFLVPFGASLCKIMYGNPNAGAYMIPLCIATLFSFYHMSLTAILNAIGMQKRAAIISIIGGIVQIIGTYLVGYQSIGIAGFLAGDIISAALCAVLSLMPIIRKIRLRISFKNWFLRPILASLLATFSSRFIYLVAIKDGISANLALIPSGIAFLLIYLITLRILGTSFIAYLKKLQS